MRVAFYGLRKALANIGLKDRTSQNDFACSDSRNVLMERLPKIG